jgi:ribosomal protein S18 acetylase RimI-like enzyme
MSLFLIRDVANNDLPYLLDIDVKCFEMPYPIEAWRFLATDAHIKIATYNHKVIGFTVYQFESSTGEEGGTIDTMKVGKLAIKEQYRGIGAGKRLMRQVFQHAYEIQCKYVKCAVAEHLIYNEDQKLLRFLKHWKFEATGLRKEAMEMYGQKIDFIEFRAEVTDQIKVLG